MIHHLLTLKLQFNFHPTSSSDIETKSHVKSFHIHICGKKAAPVFPCQHVNARQPKLTRAIMYVYYVKLVLNFPKTINYNKSKGTQHEVPNTKIIYNNTDRHKTLVIVLLLLYIHNASSQSMNVGQEILAIVWHTPKYSVLLWGWSWEYTSCVRAYVLRDLTNYLLHTLHIADS